MRIWITIYHTLLRERFVRRKLCHNDIFFKSRFNVCKVHISNLLNSEKQLAWNSFETAN